MKDQDLVMGKGHCGEEIIHSTCDRWSLTVLPGDQLVVSNHHIMIILVECGVL